jgi:hypothetical protein
VSPKYCHIDVQAQEGIAKINPLPLDVVGFFTGSTPDLARGNKIEYQFIFYGKGSGRGASQTQSSATQIAQQYQLVAGAEPRIPQGESRKNAD